MDNRVFLNTQNFIFKYHYLIYYLFLHILYYRLMKIFLNPFTLIPKPRLQHGIWKKRIRKPKPLPLARSLLLIAEERVNVARRTRERIALIGSDTEYDQNWSEDKATQTDVPLREVLVEIHEWHTCLNAFCFCLVLLCMNLLYFQWLYTTTKLTRV